MMYKWHSSLLLVFCQQVVGLLAARETGKFSFSLHSQRHKTGVDVGITKRKRDNRIVSSYEGLIHS